MSAGASLAGRRIRPLALPALPPRLRRWALIALAACLVLAAGYQFWLRDSSFVSVEEVKITGLTTKDAARVRAALESAAHTMSTLHVEQDELVQAIAAYPVVRELEVHPDFPHRLEIRVIEHRPAAIVGGLPVAGDGTILRGLPVEGSLPTIDVRGKLGGARLTHPAVLRAALVAGAAPAALHPRIERVDMRSEDGIVVVLRDGPEVIFGNAEAVRAKWIAATRVLADPDAAGASYVDVRLPGRPAAGGLPAETVVPVAPAGVAEVTPADPAVPDPAAVDPATAELAPPAGTEPVAPTGAEQAAPPTEATPAPQPTPAPVPPAAESTGGGAGPAPPG